MESSGKPIVASYCTSFLKPEMLHIYRQITALRSVQTFVMTKKLQNSERFPFSDIEIIPPPQTNLLRHGWLKFVKGEPPIIYRGEYQVLATLLARRHADLMHIYFGHTGVHLLPFIEQWKKPCVVSFHGADVARKADIPEYPKKLRQLFETVPLILARSKSLADRLVELGCSADRIRINRTGIPTKEFPFIRRDAPQHGKWKILQACRLIPKKGIATSLRAFAMFLKENPKAELRIAGKGPLQPQLEALAARLGISEKVRFCGFVSQSELMDLYATSHLFVHPSETPPDENQEGIPNSILEAMATGLPVLATYHGGIPEAVEHGRTGMLAEERDAEALGSAMLFFSRSAQLCGEFGYRATLSVSENFEQEAQIDQLEACYDEAIELARGRVEAASSGVGRLSPRFAEELSVD
jgi:colanic acid/amylovoran biosynthesis glycosyltransferase